MNILVFPFFPGNFHNLKTITLCQITEAD